MNKGMTHMAKKIVINSDMIWESLTMTGQAVVSALYWKLPAIRAQLNAEAKLEGVRLQFELRDDGASDVDTLDVSLMTFA
jgi:hypothetical protein